MYYLVFDTETNGLPRGKKYNFDFSDVYLYQLAYYKYDESFNLYSKINLYVDLEDYNNFKYIEKNKITIDDLKTKGKKIKNILKFLNNILNDVSLLIAHNLDFDINVLLTESKRNNNYELYDKLLTIPKFDTMRVAGCFGLNLINKPFPSQEAVYNLLFNEDNKDIYKNIHDADDDTKHCGEIFCNLVGKWGNCIIKFGRFKKLNIQFWKQSLNVQIWCLKKYYESIREFKEDNLNNNKAYNQSYFTDYLNYVKFKNPEYIEDIKNDEESVKIELL